MEIKRTKSRHLWCRSRTMQLTRSLRRPSELYSEPSASDYPPDVSSGGFASAPEPTTPSRPPVQLCKIPANKCPPFQLSHPFLPSPSLFLSPLSTFGHQRSSLAAARQLCDFIGSSIIIAVHFANFYLLRAALL